MYTILTINIVSTLPTFGDEFVHIKVHVPSEPSSVKSVLKPKAPVIHYHRPTFSNQKVIHHYHRRRKPVKKTPIEETVPAWENFYLSELDKHSEHHSKYHVHQPQHIEDTFVLKEHPDHYVNEPQVKIKTYKVIEEYSHDHHQPHKEYIENHPDDVNFHQHEHHQTLKEFDDGTIDDVELVESLEHDHLQHVHHSEQKYPIDTVKFEKEEPQYHYQKKGFYTPKKEIVQVIKYKKLPKYDTQPDYHQKIIKEEHIYQDYHTDQTDVLNVPKSTPVIPKPHYENYNIEDDLLPEIIEESSETYDTEKTTNYNNDHHVQEDNKVQYNYKTPSAYHYRAPVSDISIQQPIEYESPTHVHQHHHSHAYQPHTESRGQYAAPAPTLPDTAHHYSPPNGNQHDDSLNKFASDNRKYLPPLGSNRQTTAKQNTHLSENPHATETYEGYDSYSAGHIQGLDNSNS